MLRHLFLVLSVLSVGLAACKDADQVVPAEDRQGRAILLEGVNAHKDLMWELTKNNLIAKDQELFNAKFNVISDAELKDKVLTMMDMPYVDLRKALQRGIIGMQAVITRFGSQDSTIMIQNNKGKEETYTWHGQEAVRALPFLRKFQGRLESIRPIAREGNDPDENGITAARAQLAKVEKLDKELRQLAKKFQLLQHFLGGDLATVSERISLEKKLRALPATDYQTLLSAWETLVAEARTFVAMDIRLSQITSDLMGKQSTWKMRADDLERVLEDNVRLF